MFKAPLGCIPSNPVHDGIGATDLQDSSPSTLSQMSRFQISMLLYVYYNSGAVKSYTSFKSSWEKCDNISQMIPLAACCCSNYMRRVFFVLVIVFIVLFGTTVTSSKFLGFRAWPLRAFFLDSLIDLF
jgi:hypothetical protein